jgi:hypothetical protein
MVKKSANQKTKKPSEGKKTTTIKPEEDRYVIRLIKGEYKAKKFSKRMKLGRITLYDGSERDERTYSKFQVDKLIKKGEKDKSIEQVSYL